MSDLFIVCLRCVDGMKHPTKRVVQWSQVIVKMSNIVTIIDDLADKLLLQRKNNKPNAMQPDEKIIRLVIIVIRMMTIKGVFCDFLRYYSTTRFL